jgi:hypothetical protein
MALPTPRFRWSQSDCWQDGLECSDSAPITSTGGECRFHTIEIGYHDSLLNCNAEQRNELDSCCEF